MLSWNSPRLIELRKQWDQIDRGIRASGKKDTEIYIERVNRLTDLLRRRLSYGDLRQLSASCNALPLTQKDWSEFDDFAVQEIVTAFLESGDRDNLVAFLSRRCPENIGRIALERYLLIRAQHLKDPILILGDAYAKSSIPVIRKTIATMLRHAFTALGVVGRDDDEFVKNAMKCYTDERDSLRVNDFYDPHYASWRDPFEHPLFVRVPQ